MGVKPRHTTKRLETYCWHLICTVTKRSYVSAGQTIKQTVKYVTNSELKRICYKEPFRWNSWLFGHVRRMEDNRKLKTLMFRIVDGMNKRGRPCREWMNDIVSWCKSGLHKQMETHYKTSNGHQQALVPWFLKKKSLTNQHCHLPITAEQKCHNWGAYKTAL